MPDTDAVAMPVLGAADERCVECDTPLAADQRYCLHCGRRRGELRVPFREHIAVAADGAAVRAAPGPEAGAGTLAVAPTPVEGLLRRMGAVQPAAVAALLLLALAVGALVGRSTVSTPKIAAAPAPVVRVNIPPAPVVAAPAAATAPATFTSDWPKDRSGWTVELSTLDNASGDVAAVQAAKTSATSQGATQVGALDSDDYDSLDPGRYVIYSGIYKTKAAAAKARKGLHADFPAAKVVQVKSGSAATAAKTKKALKNLSSSSGGDYSKKTKKLPDTLSTGGQPPPKDGKAPGGGSGTK